MTSLSPPMRSSLESRRIHLTAAPVAVLSIASILRTGGGDFYEGTIPAAHIPAQAADEPGCQNSDQGRSGRRIPVRRNPIGTRASLANQNSHRRSSALRVSQTEDAAEGRQGVGKARQAFVEEGQGYE